MADTGAPYFLPYPLPTDLVKDGADAIKALAEDVASAIAGIPVLAGIGSNVVQTVKTDPFSTSSVTFTNVTGLGVTITPTTNTSKVLIIAQVAFGPSFSTGASNFMKLVGGNTSSFVGNADGSRIQTLMAYSREAQGERHVLLQTVAYLDSPASTSPQTYDIQVRTTTALTGGARTIYVNRSHSDTNSELGGRGASSIIAIEVAA